MMGGSSKYNEDLRGNEVADVLDIVGSQNETTGAPHRSVFSQRHDEIVYDESWWWALYISLCVIALFGNSLFIVTVIYYRKSPTLKTFVTAVIVTVAVLDIVDVIRIIPVLFEHYFREENFRHVFCTLGVFHELSVSLILTSLAVAVCFRRQTTTVSKFWKVRRRNSDASNASSMAQKILIPVILLVAASAAFPLFLVPYEKLSHSCTDPLSVINIIDIESKTFASDLYSTIITAFTCVFPILIMPLALLIAPVRACASGQCCAPGSRQGVGEIIMTMLICLVYLTTLVGVILPKIDDVIDIEEVNFGKTPLLWEIANNAARPLSYFIANPGIWDGVRSLCKSCCKKRKKSYKQTGRDECGCYISEQECDYTMEEMS